MRLRITHTITFEHGEYAPEESEFEIDIDSWDDLASELLTEDGRYLDVIKIEVI